MPKEKSELKQRFNQMAVDIGTGMFALQMTLASFVTELLELHEGRSAECDISVPHLTGDEFTTISISRVHYEPGDELVHVTTKMGTIPWNELNILAQDMIATFLHMQFSADDILQNLS